MADLRHRVEKLENASSGGANGQRIVLIVQDAGAWYDSDSPGVQAAVEAAIQKTDLPCVVVDLGRPSTYGVFPAA